MAELEAAGLVQRSTFAGDSRGVTVTITDRGRDKLREAQDTHFGGLEAHLFSRLSWSEVVELARLTAKILA